MPRVSKRKKTGIKGLSYRYRPSQTDPNVRDKVWHGRFKDPVTDKQREVVLGWEDHDNMDIDDAFIKLIGFRKGVEKSTKEKFEESKRIEAEKKANSFQGLWESYIESSNTATGGIRHKDKPIFKTDRSFYTNHLLPHLSKISPSDLTESDVNQLARVIHKKGRAPQTIKHCLALLKRILKHGKIELDFEFKMPRVDNTKLEDLNEEELSSLHKALDKSTNRQVADMMRLILCTGMRQGEVRKLKWGHVNFSRGGRILLKDPKGKVDVTIPMSSKAREIIKRQRTGNIVPLRSTYVFPGKNGAMRGQFTKSAKKIAVAAGLPDNFRPCHGLRHYFFTDLVARGVNIEIVRRLAGHKDITTTQRYLSARDEDMREAVEMMGEKLHGNL